MKYVIVLGDGMSDYPLPSLGNKTPIEVANTPNIDYLAKYGQVGLCKTVPNTMAPGSDVANLSVIGYDPEVYYTGRSPLEAVSLGIDMASNDIALRCNLVTLSDEEEFSDKTMLDYSAGEISTEEAKAIIQSIQNELGTEDLKFYNGVSYRHCVIDKQGSMDIDLTPPHDILEQKITHYLPKGEEAQKYIELMEQSNKILQKHPINIERGKKGINQATHIWLWGQGKKPKLDNFYQKYKLKGGIISAVDLLKGIAIAAGMEPISVEGATGTLTTNFAGKAQACLDALDRGLDYIYLHIEAPDECSHQGDLRGKIKAIEKVDEVVGWVFDKLNQGDEDFVIGVLPDHPTPLSLRTHTSDAVPYVIYKSNNKLNLGIQYNEKEAPKGEYLDKGIHFIQKMLQK